MKQVQFDLLTVLCESVIVRRPVHEKMRLLNQWYEAGYDAEVDPLQSTQIVKEMGVPECSVETILGELQVLLQEYQKLFEVRQNAVHRLRAEKIADEVFA